MYNHTSYAAVCMICYAVVSILNDSLAKYLVVSSISSSQLVFLRFAIGALILLAPLLSSRSTRSPKDVLRTPFLHLHAIRGLILVMGMNLYTQSLQKLPLSINVIGCFVIPILVVVLAYLFLNESIKDNLINTLLCFVGVLVCWSSFLNCQQINMILPLIGSIILFASVDILNKKILNCQEPTLLIMFYTAFFAALFSAISAFSNWQHLTAFDWAGVIVLGIGSNLVFFLLLQSCKYAPLSYVQPFKYIELPLSFAAGYLLFGEHLSMRIITGSVIIVLSALMALKKGAED